MRKEFIYGTTTWIDLENPSYDEIISVADEFSLDSISTKDLINQTEYSRARVLPHYIHLTMYFPTDRYDNTTLWETKLDIMVFGSTLITAHNSPLDGLLEFEKKLETQYLIQKKTANLSGYVLFTSLLKLLYGIISEEIHNVSGDLKKVEDKIFSGEEEYMVYTLASVNRIILSCNRTLKNHAQLFETILIKKHVFSDESFIEYIEDLHTQYHYLESQVENTKLILDDLRETGFLLVQLGSAKSFYVITSIACLSTPIATMCAVIASGLFNDTFFDTTLGIYLLLAFAGLASILLFTYFTKKKSKHAYVSSRL